MKSIQAARKPVKSSTIFIKLPSFHIHEDTTVDNAVSKLPIVESACAASSKVLSTCPALVDENVNTLNQVALTNKGSVISVDKSVLASNAVKVIAISESEKNMNGAPEGTLYEAQVIEDDALLPSFASSEDPAALFTAALGSYSDKAVWIEKFEFLTLLRRVLRHEVALVSGGQIDRVVSAVCECLTSLRSTVVRNALLAIRSLLPLQEVTAAQGELLCTALLLRLSSAQPKFMQECCLSVCEAAASSISPRTFVPAAAKFLAHRSLEVARRSGVLLVRSAQGCVDRQRR
ncbi:hypothetical protein EON64_16835, partial [archaeon]